MRNCFRSHMKIAALLILATFISSCTSPNRQNKALDETLLQYEQVIRWSEWDGAIEFLDPQSMIDKPISTLDMDRLRLFRVTRYQVRSATPFNEGNSFRQVVEISLFNRNRAVEKRVIDQQEWRYNSERERWFLHSSLPDVVSAR
jgi:hypothetical protein